MRYFLLLVVFALLPVAVAAPIPRDVRETEFGSEGLLTLADLEKVRFDTRRYAGGTDKPLKLDLADAKRKYDLAIHLPRTKFHEGDPMPVYFIARNVTDRSLSLVEFPQLFGPEPFLTDDCDIYIQEKGTRDRLGGPPLRVNYQRRRSKNEVIPVKGYFVTKGDLAGMGGEPLRAGEYEVQWRYTTGDGENAQIAAAPVAFSIAKARGAKPKFTKQPGVQFFALHPEPDREPFQPFVSNRCGLMSVREVSQVLGVGRCGVYVPDVYTIPPRDKLLTVSAQWKPYRNEDRLAITLESTFADKPVQFAEMPHFYLQAIIPDEPPLSRRVGTTPRFARDVDSKKLVTPLTIEMRLPDGWRKQLATTESARIAVVVASESLEWDHDNKKGDGNNNVWNGVLRTQFTELKFQPALPLCREPE